MHFRMERAGFGMCFERIESDLHHNESHRIARENHDGREMTKLGIFRVNIRSTSSNLDYLRVNQETVLIEPHLQTHSRFTQSIAN